MSFLRLAEAEPDRYAVIPAGRSVNEVAEHIQRVVDAMIGGEESTDVADTFEPIAPRGVFEGVPTERMSPEDAQKAVEENRYAEPPQFLTEPIDVDGAEDADSAEGTGSTEDTENAAEPDPETYRAKLQRQSMIEQQARQRLRDARRNS